MVVDQIAIFSKLSQCFDVTNRSYLVAGRVPALNGRTEMQVLFFSVLARTPVDTGGGSPWRNCFFTSPGDDGRPFPSPALPKRLLGETVPQIVPAFPVSLRIASGPLACGTTYCPYVEAARVQQS